MNRTPLNKIQISVLLIALLSMMLVSAAYSFAGAPAITGQTESSGTATSTVIPGTTQSNFLAFNTLPYVTVSQCAPCHGANYDKFNNPDLIFKHDVHLSRGIRCAGCHTEFPHAPGRANEAVKPPMAVCYNCHGLSHSSQGIVASGACTLCHPANFKRLPADHSPSFRASLHKIPASKDSFACTSCHGVAFCQSCHMTKMVAPANHGPKLPAGGKPTPQFVALKVKTETEWKKTHGIERDKGNCEVCHDNRSCTACHKTPMPHPSLWLGTHKNDAKSIATKADCKVCHESKTECSNCHHQFEGKTLLAQSNCKSCHAEYNKPLSELIWSTPVGQRSKGIIIHKAHFEMTKTDPFDCNECHGREYVTAKNCFSFELCYECHGRERGGSLIAKWGGQELCYRCHKMK